MNFNRINKLSMLVTSELKRKPTIMIEQNTEQSFRVFGSAKDVEVRIDSTDWKISDEIKEFVKVLSKSNSNNEEKILKVYQKLCEDYTYDDNVLSYIKKNDDDTFYLPDEYGRKINTTWKENREKHNRRNCFEMSRILAKSIEEILRLSDCLNNYDICIIWDEAVTHYLVGLVCKDYCVTLDLDDFNQIKDLTRMKTDLTLEGIKVLDDPYDKFGQVVEKFNSNRNKFAKDFIEAERIKSNQYHNTEETEIESDDLNFLKFAVQILKEEYNLDSAGMYEYLKEIVDTRLGTKTRKKLWKEVENEPGIGNRYTRCLMVNINDVSYIIDVTKDNHNEILRPFDSSEIESSNSKFIQFNKMSRDWKEDPYDGR